MSSKIGFHYGMLPFAFLYGIAIKVRNMLYDTNIIKSTQFRAPVICVGNLEAGGVGKTPMVEYLIRLLQDSFRIAVVSRGYKRKSKGFVLAEANSNAQTIGDEAFQIKTKFPGIIVAVDRNRCRAISKLLEMNEAERPQVILLDDAFQHRRLTPSLSILLTDHNRLYYKDKLLPVGRLREFTVAIRRAQIVITTKCDPALKPIDCRIISNEMRLLAYQSLYFSCIAYQPLESVFSHTTMTLESIHREDEILLVTGVANPQPLIDKIKSLSDNVEVMTFRDHHRFSKKDIRKIQATISDFKSSNPLIICTEKDGAKLRSNDLVPDELKPLFYSAPVKTEFLQGKGEAFDKQIINHINLIEKSSILHT
ncbi:MAG: tetraacyldisaccharide 4'-kinase [Tannerella sp.]|nr:tetraacyldisaccharide 4'-kinase [Tannerella sp.]